MELYHGRIGHTQFPLPDLLRHNPEDRENLNHDLSDDVCHSSSRPDVYIFFKTLKKEFHAAKQVYKSILTCANILNGLCDIFCQDGSHATSGKRLTWRRTPMPAKMALEAGNTYQICQCVDLAQLNVS